MTIYLRILYRAAFVRDQVAARLVKACIYNLVGITYDGEIWIVGNNNDLTPLSGFLDRANKDVICSLSQVGVGPPIRFPSAAWPY